MSDLLVADAVTGFAELSLIEVAGLIGISRRTALRRAKRACTAALRLTKNAAVAWRPEAIRLHGTPEVSDCQENNRRCTVFSPRCTVMLDPAALVTMDLVDLPIAVPAGPLMLGRAGKEPIARMFANRSSSQTKPEDRSPHPRLHQFDGPLR